MPPTYTYTPSKLGCNYIIEGIPCPHCNRSTLVATVILDADKQNIQLAIMCSRCFTLFLDKESRTSPKEESDQ